MRSRSAAAEMLRYSRFNDGRPSAASIAGRATTPIERRTGDVVRDPAMRNGRGRWLGLRHTGNPRGVTLPAGFHGYANRAVTPRGGFVADGREIVPPTRPERRSIRFSFSRKPDRDLGLIRRIQSVFAAAPGHAPGVRRGDLRGCKNWVSRAAGGRRAAADADHRVGRPRVLVHPPGALHLRQGRLGRRHAAAHLRPRGAARAVGLDGPQPAAADDGVFLGFGAFRSGAC